MDFNKEFGHWWINDPSVVSHHRLKKPGNTWRQEPVCSIQPNIWVSEDQVIIYKNICKTCLNTYTKKEIKDLKQYLINKKLGVRV